MSYQIKVAPDRVNGLYAVGEPVTFEICIEDAGRVTVEWELTNDGWQPLADGKLETVDGVGSVTAKLDEPGFVRLHVNVSGTDEPVTATAAAGVAPHRIEPSAPSPADFDAFWADKLADLSRIPLAPEMTRVTSGVERMKAWDVKVQSLDVPVSGYLACPDGAKPGSLPAMITFHGAGVRSAGLEGAAGWAKNGLLAMDVNAHGIPNGRAESYYAALADGELSNYWLRGRESRETYYFLEMFLRVVRAIDFVTEQPEWDGKTLVLYGTSQGGAQALAGAALDPRVTFVVAGVTAMANLGGPLTGPPAGWPGMRNELRSMPPDEAERIVNTLQYFDSVNFAARSRADGFFTVGFLDSTCPPTSVYMAYNAFPNKKAIFNDIRAVHENTPAAVRLMHQHVLRHITSTQSFNIFV